MTDEVPFAVVPASRRPSVDERREAGWKPVLEALLDGRTLFIAIENISDEQVKYLRHSLSNVRASQGLERVKLRSERGLYKAARGRFLWTEPMTNEREQVPFEEVEE